jgi:glutaredoxin
MELTMKNKTLKHIFIAAIAGATLITTVDAQDREKPHGGRQLGDQNNQGNFGAPNSLRDGDRDGNANRQTVREPSGEREDNSENTHKPKPGQGHKPGSGMGRVDKPGQKPKPNLKDVLELTDEQAKALHAAHKKWHIFAKSIHGNKELSKEEKQAELKKGFQKLQAALKEILNEKQYAKLRELHRRRARPNDREQQASGQNQNRRKPNGADVRRRIAEALKLTDEQKKQLRAVHHYAIKKIKAILANKELSKEEKQSEIKAIHQTARARRQEILTDEQQSRLRGILAYLRSQRQNQTQPVSTENGRPQQGRGGREQGRPKPGGSDREQGRPKPGGNDREQGSKFPKHWGNPPAVQTRDYVKLPGNFGHGSSTLAKWIEEKMKRDHNRQVPQPVGLQAPSPRPTDKPGITAVTSDHTKVTLYVVKGCSYCVKAAALLKSKGVNFVKKDIREDKKAYHEVKVRTKKAGVKWRGGVPVTAAGKHVIVGYNKSALESLGR